MGFYGNLVHKFSKIEYKVLIATIYRYYYKNIHNMYNLTFLKKYLFKALFPKKCRFFGN